MAETLLPSVRGRTRTAVAVLALTAATASGALLGLAAGVVALPLRWLGPLLPGLAGLPTAPASLVGGSPAGALAAMARFLGDLGVVPGSGAVAAVARFLGDLGVVPGSGAVAAVAGTGSGSGSLASSGLPLVLGLLAVGLALDVVMLASGRLRPVSLGRQVPREWGRWLRPEVVAVLYGTRLGVGPSTMLSTWTWWSVTVGAALVGPGTAAATGACFGLTRILVTILVSSRLGRRRSTAANCDVSAQFWPSGVAVPASRAGSRRLVVWVRRRAAANCDVSAQFWPSGVAVPAGAVRRLTMVGRARRDVPWFAGLGRRPRISWAVVDVVMLLVAVSVAAAGCASTGPQAAPPAATVVGPGPPPAGRVGSGGSDGSLTDPGLVPPPTTPAQLEDFVRLPSPNATPAPGSAGSGSTTAPGRRAAAEPAAVPAAPEALAAALVATLPGFEPVGEPGADRFLDLEGAARIQPDPVAETALLQTRGFQGGWTRAFRNPTNDVVVASVYQFEDDGEAEFYLEDGLITIGGYGGRFFDIAALPGVRGFHQGLPADGAAGPLTVLGAAFQAGPRWFLVYVLGSESTVTPTVLIDAVTAQRQAALSS